MICPILIKLSPVCFSNISASLLSRNSLKSILPANTMLFDTFFCLAQPKLRTRYVKWFKIVIGMLRVSYHFLILEYYKKYISPSSDVRECNICRPNALLFRTRVMEMGQLTRGYVSHRFISMTYRETKNENQILFYKQYGFNALCKLSYRLFPP